MKKRKKVLEGRVYSTKTSKTIVVKVARIQSYPLYKKKSVHYKKFKAHDESEQAQVNDLVKIIESRPLSKDKRFRLLEIVKKEAHKPEDLL